MVHPPVPGDGPAALSGRTSRSLLSRSVTPKRTGSAQIDNEREPGGPKRDMTRRLVDTALGAGEPGLEVEHADPLGPDRDPRLSRTRLVHRLPDEGGTLLAEVPATRLDVLGR